MPKQNERDETLLGLLFNNRVSSVKKINRNLYYQVALITLGIGLIFEIDVFLNLIFENWFKIEKPDLELLLPIVLQFLFMFFGYYLDNFLGSSRAFDEYIDDYAARFDKKTRANLVMSFKTRTIFEIVTDKFPKSKNKISYYLCVTLILILVASNHFICISIIVSKIENYIVSIIILCGFIFLNALLYHEFIKGNRDYKVVELMSYGKVIFIILSSFGILFWVYQFFIR